MASKMEMSFDKGRDSTPRLPLISDGKSLVSPAPSARTPTYRDLASNWAHSIRQTLTEKIRDKHDIEETEVICLREEVKCLFISALQKDDRHSWLNLRECVNQVAPLSHLLSGHVDIIHYLERLHQHLNVHRERLFDLQITETLNKVFTKDLADICESGVRPAKNYCPPPPARSVGLPVQKQVYKFTLPDGKDPFVLERLEDIEAAKPRILTFGDLRKSLPNVALEMATREAIWSACVGNTARAMNIDLPEYPEYLDEDDDLSSYRSSYNDEESEPDREEPQDQEEQVHPRTPMSGREAVEYFSRCYHTGQIEFMYFNLAPNRRYLPYDLIATSKAKAEREHLVFSTFGVLHVFPNHPSENLSLSDWQREAVLFSSITKIPFFKFYLLRRMFDRWHANVHFKGFAAFREQISSGLLQSVPSFGAALLHVSKLCQELLKLTFLPTDAIKCYQLGEFENAVNYMNIQAEKILERFFRYNKVIVDTTAEESFKKLQHCEQQYQHKTVFTKDSMTLQKAKKRQRARNLAQAREETRRLGNFVKLVDQILLSYLVQLARLSVTQFVYESMAKGPGAPRDGLFRAYLIFDDKHALTMSPPRERFTSVLLDTFEEIPRMLCQAALPLDGTLHQIIHEDGVESEALGFTQEVPKSSRHASLTSLMRDPKKQKPDALRRNMVSVSIAMGSQQSLGALSSGGSDRHGNRKLHEQGSVVHTPDMHRLATPSKSADNLGQATPELVLTSRDQQELAITGQGFMGQYAPVSRGNLADKLTKDESYKEAIASHETMMTTALEEIAEYCEKSSWLTEIYTYCQSWNDESVNEWRGVQAFNIEQRLNELRQWGDRVRNFDRSYVTDNAIFFIDSSGIHDILLPKLNQIFKELCQFVAEEAGLRAKEFADEMSVIVENMKQKRTDIGGFAIYAKNVSQYKKSTGLYQQQMEYIKSLFEVIRMSYRQLSSTEEKLEESVMTQWEAFLFLMQDAMEFVNTQTPLITQNLEDSFMPKGNRSKSIARSTSSADRKLDQKRDSVQTTEPISKQDVATSEKSQEEGAPRESRDFKKLEAEARALSEDATSGIFLDATQRPTEVLMEMKHLRDSFYEVQKQLEQGSKWREAITGEADDLTFLCDLSSLMNVRQQLWRYVEVTEHAILEWKQTLFAKFNGRKSMDKLLEWQATAHQMKTHLPNEDNVLAYWFRLLMDFKQELPILHKLSNDALKPRHWRTIFLGMGELYEVNTQMTVDSLLSLNLPAHTNIINQVYTAAVAEYAIEQRLGNISRFWNEREYKLAKYIPDSIYKKDEARARSARSCNGNRKVRRMEKYRQDRAERSAPKGLNVNHDNLYVLIEIEELKYLLEDSHVQVQTMLTSPYVADHLDQVVKWSDTLAQAEEITDLWITCQKKWLYQLKVFDDIDFFLSVPSLGMKFEAVHNKLVDIVQAVVHDPKVVSMVNHKRGEKGYRVHQGNKTRDTLLSIVEQQEEITKELAGRLDKARSQFPRLYFLSNTEIVELLAISRNPRALQTWAKKCFYGIETLIYSLPNSSMALNSALDVELNAHKLEVTQIHGLLGEEISLYSRLEAHQSATKWLSMLEQTMKTTLQLMLEACVQARLEDGSKQPIHLLEELSKYEGRSPRREAAELTNSIQQQFSHWILHFPAQCVLTAEAVLWERGVFKALEKQDKEEIRNLRTSLQSRLDQYSKILRENSVMMSLPFDMRTRLQLLLGALVIQGLYHRDNVDTLLANPSLSDGAFDWLRVMKYHMDICTVLRAMTDVSQSETCVQHQTSDCQVIKDEDDNDDITIPMLKQNSADDIQLLRGKTTVCTGYQFGPCLVSQMGTTFMYDHEYLGPTSRLVVTPLTNRAILSLTMSMRAFQWGSLIGPPGTGKTETIKDLAKSLGRHLVSVTCSSDLTLPIMNQYLHGTIQSGCWALFDDTDRMTKGLMSVFAQQIEYISSALRVLDVSYDNQYGIRGQPRFDKKMMLKSGDKKIRRNSLTTLHSLPAETDNLTLNRQATVPHGFKEAGLITYFEETWVRERDRRHSIEKEIEIKESELYKAMKPPPLFYEHVTLHMKPKTDFKDLASQNYPYKPHYLGNILFDGKLVKANANFACFMTLNTRNPASCDIPDNIRMGMRPCAMVVPDTRVIIETSLYCNGYSKHQILATKLSLFLDLLKKQLPRREQYDFSLRTVTLILCLACDKFRKLQKDVAIATTQACDEGDDTKAKMPELTQGEEASLILAISLILGPKMATAEDTARFRTLLRDVFPQSARPKSGSQNYSPQLVAAIEEQLHKDQLQTNQDFINKILSLYSALTMKQGVMLIGCAGSGKTTSYRTLCRAMNTLHNKDTDATVDSSLHEHETLQQKLSFQPRFLKENEPMNEAKHAHKWKRLRSVTSISNLWESLAKEDKFESPKVNLQVIYPNALGCKNLFGEFVDGIWQSGLFTTLLANAHFQTESAKAFTNSYDEKKFKIPIQPPKEIHKWFVFDGDIHPEWVDHMSSILDREQKLTLASQQKIPLPDSTSLIFEMADLTNASPSMISRCVVVHYANETVSWKFLIQSWFLNAKERWIINTSSIQVLNSLIASVFPATLTFLQAECCSALLANVSASTQKKQQVAPGIEEVTSFLRYLTAFMDNNFLRDEWEKKSQTVTMETGPGDDPSRGLDSLSGSKGKSGGQSSIVRIEESVPNYMTVIKGMFAFCYIWGFGGHLHDRYQTKFSEFASETLRLASQPIHLPENTSAYDIYIDPKLGSFHKWSDKLIEKSRNYSAHFTITPQVDRYHSLLSMLLKNRQPVLLVGEPGVGKSAMINNLIQSQYPYTCVMMSSVMTACKLQHLMVSRILDLQVRTTDPIYGNSKKTHSLFYVEDLSTAHAHPNTGSQGSLDLLRELLTQRTIYDPHRQVPISFQDVHLLATSTSPGSPGTGHGYSSHVMSSRFTRLFTTLNFSTPGEDMLHGIYTKTIHAWLEEFPTRTVQHHMEFAKALVQASIELYDIIRERLRPSPTHPHYVFSLYDLAHHIEGILLLSPRSKTKLRARAKKYTEQKQKQGEGARSRSESVTSELGGMLPEQMRSITRLWCHESTRVYGDRILAEDDQQWFETILGDSLTKNFCMGTEDSQTKMSPITEVHSQGSPGDGSVLTPGGDTPPTTALPHDNPDTAPSPETEHLDTDPQDMPQSVSVEPLNLAEERTPSGDRPASDSHPSVAAVDSGPEINADNGETPLEAGSEPAMSSVKSSSTSTRSAGAKTSSSTQSTGSVDKDQDTTESTTSSRPSQDKSNDPGQSPSHEEDEDSEDASEDISSCSSSNSSEEETDTETMTSTDAASRAQESPTYSGNQTGATSIATDVNIKQKVKKKPSGQKTRDNIKRKQVAAPHVDGESSRLSHHTPPTTLRRGGRTGTKRGVTFKAGLIADMVQEAYTGPLMSLDQIKEPEEKLTDFVFCKYIVPTHAEAFGIQAERGYTEYVEEQLSEALRTCLALYNKASSQKLDLVFFHEAVQHAARLSRVLAMPNGHSLLLSIGGSTGRATLVRLAAFFAHCKLFEPKVQPERSSQEAVVQDHIKQCSKAAALQGKQVILLIQEELGDSCIAHVCAFIKEGMYPGLYSPDEIQAIAQQMTPGQVKTTRLDKIEAQFNKFLKRVQQNIHVVFSFKYTGSSSIHQGELLHTKLQKFSMLTTVCCHIDVYHPWTYDAYMSVAEYWLRDPNSKIVVPWNEPNRPEQMYLVSMAMAYIHQSGKAAIEKLFSHQMTSYKFFSPLTFTEFIHIYKVVASYIAKEERAKIHKYECSLGKMGEAYDSIALYKRDVSNLFPRHQTALAEVKGHVECVEVQREQYKQALDTCKGEELKIECMLSPLEAMRTEAQIEFSKVNPTYQAALSALKSLKKAAVEEIKTYRVPPYMVNFVLDAVCLLFREPQNWETAKGMLIRESFFHDLEFYDKDNIPDDIYKQLGDFYNHPDFTVELVKATSMAVSHLCWWVRAVYEYATVCRTMMPRIKMLQEEEEKLHKAQTMLGAQRVEANRIKSSLESRIQAHSEAVKKAKTIEKEMQSIERKIAKANNVMDNMQTQHTLWRTELRSAKSKIRTAPGDALITAAIICYHGPLDNRTRAELMHDWLNRCEMTNFDPTLRLGRQVKPVSLSAKMENFMRPQTYSITDSVHSIQQVELYQADIASHRGDDASSIHETERASSASSVPQMSLYKHHPSVYDTSIGFKTEIRILDNSDPNVHGNPDLESIDASSMSARNLLAVREGYTLQDVLSNYEQLSDWRLKGLPTDVHSIHNALIMKVCCYNRKHCWPLLIDQDEQAELWVRTIQQGAPTVMADPDWTVIDLQTLPGFHGYERGSSSARSRVTEGTADYSLADDSITVYSARQDVESRGLPTRQSGMSLNSTTNDYRAVTSIYTSIESFRSKLTDNIDRPEDNLWVISADHPDVDVKILNAIVHGVTLLITHLETRPLDPLFRGLLLKQFSVDTSGQRVVKIGDVDFPYHPEFALYLSSSVPLFLKGDGICELPVQKMCPIDLSLSQELVIDTILCQILRTDRPEFEGQRRSMDRDIINHQRELHQQNELIMKKTLDIEGPILEEKSMLESLIHCQKQVDMHKLALEESQYMRESLEEKRTHLITVATHGAKIYEIIQRMSVLSPLYHVSLSCFMKVVRDTIKQQHRGKGSLGAPSARAQELINALTSSVYKYVSHMMYESHLHLFMLLVTLERLRMSQQLTNQELGLFVNGFVSSELEDNIKFEDKPSWLSNKVWLDCAGLESTVDAFHHLKQSLTRHSTQWQEYFKCPVVLLNDIPGTELVDLTIFQKCLLWRICCPHKMLDVCDSLVLHELGGLVSPPRNYSVHEAYKHSDGATPVVFLLPSSLCDDSKVNNTSKGHSFSNPTRQIHQYSRECGMEGKVHVVTCGIQSQLSELQHALQESMMVGYWLIIQNAHLSAPWNKDLLELLKTVVYSSRNQSKDSAEADESAPGDHSTTLTTDDSEETVSMVTEQNESGSLVHKDFRLWVTTRSDEGRLIPGLLIQYGLKVTCEQTHNIHDTLKRTYTAAEIQFTKRDKANLALKKMFGDVNPSIPLCVLYTLIVHRRNYGNGAFSHSGSWSPADMAAILEQFQIILSMCQRPRGLSEITQLIFGGHCIDPVDYKVIEALVSATMQSPTELKQLTDQSPGVASVLSHLLGLSSSDTTFEERVDSLVDIDGAMMSLPQISDSELMKKRSRGLLDDLVRVIGAPELISVPLELSNNKAENILHDVLATLETFPDFPNTNPDAFYPMELFLHQEALIARDLIGQLKAEAQHLLSAALGTYCVTHEDQIALVAISQHRVPASWCKQTFPACTSLPKWVSLLRKKIHLLSDYTTSSSQGHGPVTFDLGAFHRPDRLLHAILQNYVRREFKDLHTCGLDVQFLPLGIMPAAAPASGIYISGVTLHNATWCPKKLRLVEASADHVPTKMPIIWLKPTDRGSLERNRRELDHELYDCPVYSTGDCQCLRWENIIGNIALPTSVSPYLWMERRTYLSCQLKL